MNLSIYVNNYSYNNKKFKINNNYFKLLFIFN